jgi:hypothetical protein
MWVQFRATTNESSCKVLFTYFFVYREFINNKKSATNAAVGTTQRLQMREDVPHFLLHKNFS